MIPKATIKTITQKIAQEFKPEKIILFGSYAWGKPGPGSDLDLFIIKDSTDKRIERACKAAYEVAKTGV